jgi:exosome complex component RRP42
MEERYALELIQKNKRIDGRKFDDFRPINIKTGLIENAEGSAQIKLGDTEVIVGVKLTTGEPYSDSPDRGNLIVNAEFTPLASPDFESGPPGEDATELARVVDRGIRESESIELEKLCIESGEKVWNIFVDIHIINHNGNLLDTAALGAIAALHDAKIPKMEGDEIKRGEYEKPLPMSFKPINVTVCKIGDKFLLDPILEEEDIIEARLSISVRDDDKICALQKQGFEELDIADIEKMLDIAIKKSKEIRKMLK